MSVSTPRLGADALRVALAILLLSGCADDAETVVGSNRASGADAGEPLDDDDAGTGPSAQTDAQTDAQSMAPVDASAPELDAQVDANERVSVVMDAQWPVLDARPLTRASVDGAAGDAGDASLGPDALISGDELAEALLSKLQSCGIVGAGSYRTRPVLDAFDRCRTQCELDASCATLSSTRCSGQRDAPLENCLTACTTAPRDDGFVCGTRRIRMAWVCDGVQHCAGREDEASCTPTACTDGTQVYKPTPLCDGVKDCVDGSDELSCAPYCT